MKKQMKRTISILLSVVVGSVIILQFFLISTLANEVARQDRARVWDTKLIYTCYNNRIQPCDDENVTKWNKQNPNNAITEKYLRQPTF